MAAAVATAPDVLVFRPLKLSERIWAEVNGMIADHVRDPDPLKCDVCGQFTSQLTLVWSTGPEPEPDHEVGDCCRSKQYRLP